MSLGGWTRIGRQIGLLRSCSSWWLGDWLVYGRAHFPGRYKQAMSETELDYQTLRNYAWIAGRFEASRRREALSFQHHAVVAALPAAQQDTWLDLAISRLWSVAQLRGQVQLAAKKSRSGTRAFGLQLKLPPDRYELWNEAARRGNAGLLDWITQVLDDAAAESLEVEEPGKAIAGAAGQREQLEMQETGERIDNCTSPI